MKKLFLASAAALALATVGVAHAADGNGCPKQLAASGMENQQGQTNRPSGQLAASGKPELSTTTKSQLAASGKPELSTATKSQLAASGMPQGQTNRPSTQLAASGKPEVSSNGTQLAAINPDCR